MIAALLGRLAAGEDLPLEAMSSLIDEIAAGRMSDPEIGLMLTALHAKRETAEELAGAAAALRRHATPIHSHRDPLIDTCGTGGGWGWNV